MLCNSDFFTIERALSKVIALASHFFTTSTLAYHFYLICEGIVMKYVSILMAVLGMRSDAFFYLFSVIVIRLRFQKSEPTFSQRSDQELDLGQLQLDPQD